MRSWPEPSGPAPHLSELLTAVAAFIGLVLLVGLVLSAIDAAAPELASSIDIGALIAIELAVSAGAMLTASWWSIRRPPAERRLVLGLSPLDEAWVRRSILVGVGLFFGSVVLRALVLAFTGAGAELPGAGDYGLAKASPARFAFILLIGAYLGPLAEEMLFRGLIFRWLSARTGFVLAALASSLLFGAVHLFGGASHALFAFLVGLPLCWLYAAAGSLWAPVFAHRTINAIGLTLMWLGS